VRARVTAPTRTRARADAPRWLVAIWATTLAACAASEPPGAARPTKALASARAGGSASSDQNAEPASAQPGSAPTPLRPAGSGARVYAAAASDEDRAAVPRDPLRAGILKEAIALARREKRPAPEPDARLDAALNDLAHNLRSDDLPALEVVDFLLTHYGIVEPSPHLLLSRATAGADREIRQQAGKEIAEVIKTSPVGRVGVGIDRAGDLMYVVIGLQETHLALEPLPRQLPHGGRVAVAGKLVGSYRAPHLVITWPDGHVTEEEPAPHGDGFRGQLACGRDGKYQVEVTADDATGSSVLANFPVYCGVEPPALAPGGAGTRQAPLNAQAAEREVLALVNRDRATTGAPPVKWDERLAEVARGHSRDMAEHDFVAHVSPRTGSALERVHKAGLTPGLILENVGRAYSAQEAEAGFMASPGHRANVVDPKATVMGVGIVLGKPVTGTIPLYVTQILTN
jgi:uncharacterized protein YkwD